MDAGDRSRDALPHAPAPEDEYRLIAENASDFVMRNHDGVCRWVSPSVTRVLGWRPDEVVGVELLSFVHPDDRQTAQQARARLRRDGEVRRELVRLRTADGDHRWMSLTAHHVSCDDGPAGWYVVGARDVHEETVARQELAASEALFRTVMQSSTIGMALATLDGFFDVVNPPMCELLQRPASWFVGRRLPDVLHPDDVPSVLAERRSLLAGDASSSSGAGVLTSEVRLIRADGQVLHVRRSAVVLHDAQGTPTRLLLQVVDLTAEHEVREALSYQAFHDPLTGLRNRAWILDILGVDLRAANRSGRRVGVLFVDLDGFKLVNDSLGHSAGDEVLTHVADRIAGAMRPGDRVGRFGGDEFVIVVPEVDEPEELERVAARVLRAIAVPLTVRGHLLVPGASLGIALSTPSATPATLLRDTDAALFRAKESGRGRWQFFDERMHSRAVERLTLDTELREALARDELLLHYQPIVTLDDRQVCGLEALLRWRHPTRGLLAPGAFLDVAEDSGLIVPIGRQVLDKVAAQLAADPHLPTVSVNVSAVELAHDDWIDCYVDTLARHRVDPVRVTVEVTETAVLPVLERTRAAFSTLRTLGSGLQLDDFGTGHSSISLLRELPVTGIKLDRRFVSDLTAPGSYGDELAAGLAGLVRGLHLDGTAEGIETEQQARALLEQGWRRGQGYLFARPAPLS